MSDMNTKVIKNSILMLNLLFRPYTMKIIYIALITIRYLILCVLRLWCSMLYDIFKGSTPDGGPT